MSVKTSETTGVTKTGFRFKLHSDIKEDYELVELLADLETNPLSLTSVVNRLLGKDQAVKLKEHVRNENGIVSTSLMMDEIGDIFTGGGESLKNS